MEKELERSEVKPDNKKPVMLKGGAAILKWLEGRGAWNKWMEENPNTDVDFSGVDFSYEALKWRFPNNENLQRLIDENEYEEVISFDGYKFSGEASFWKATFSGVAYFSEATFRGKVSFIQAKFSGRVDFFATTFRGVAYFNDATFSGEALFIDAKFSADAKFLHAVFSDEANFNSAIFSDDVDYQNSNFESILLLELEEAEKIKSFNFKGAAFDRVFSIAGNFNCIPDLRQTKTSHHVDLSELMVQLNRDNENGAILGKALNKEDAERLCRLKEIAESNKNHERALAFHADELRAKRWVKFNLMQSLLDGLFSLTSNYGQSILRPCVCLMLSIFIFSQLTLSYADTNKKPSIESAIVISIATVTPFISISKEARTNNLNKVFSHEVPERYYLYGYLHALISIIFIFLIGLGLRNRFRI